MNRSERQDLLFRALDERVLCLDAAMGTAIQARNLTAADFGGEAFEGCNEHLVLTRPDVIESIHREHLEAGADIVESCTFQSTDLVLAEYPPLQEKAYEITRTGAEIARRAADTLSTPERPRFVAGSMGPSTKAISVTGGVTFLELVRTFGGQARALVQGGVDYLLLETCIDTRTIKAALVGIDDAFNAVGFEIPVAVSVTIESQGTMLAGQAIDAVTISLEHRKLLYMGLNCATGPELMTDHLRVLSELCKTRVACVPNAGLPDENGHYLETPEMMAHRSATLRRRRLAQPRRRLLRDDRPAHRGNVPGGEGGPTAKAADVRAHVRVRHRGSRRSTSRSGRSSSASGPTRSAAGCSRTSSRRRSTRRRATSRGDRWRAGRRSSTSAFRTRTGTKTPTCGDSSSSQ